MTKEADIGVVKPQTRKRQQPVETGRVKKAFSPRTPAECGPAERLISAY